MYLGDCIFGYEASALILDRDFIVWFIVCCRGVDELFRLFVGDVCDVSN